MRLIRATSQTPFPEYDTVALDFLRPFSFIRSTYLGGSLIQTPKSYQIILYIGGFIWIEVWIPTALCSREPLHDTADSKISPLHLACFHAATCSKESSQYPCRMVLRRIKSLCCKRQRGVKFGSRESSKKNFGRLTRPLKKQPCKKNHKRWNFSILYLWESSKKTLPAYSLMIQTSNSNYSANL